MTTPVSQPASAPGAPWAPRSVQRADHVGSLLRPERLKKLLDQIYGPDHMALHETERQKDITELRQVEDDSIAEVVQRQIATGVDVVTDGEFRRRRFMNSFYDAMAGTIPSEDVVRFVDAEGNAVESPSTPTIVRRLEKIDSPAAREAAYLSSITDHPFKVTFPAGSWFCIPFLSKPALENEAYRDLDELLDHTIALERELIADTVAAGATYIQLDFPAYWLLVDEYLVSQLPAFGTAFEALLDRAVAADAAILEGIPSHVTTALHFCRGNFRSRWLTSGTLEPVAERMFSLPYDRFLVEWEDTDREGDYTPLRLVPEGPIVAMGIVSTKRGEVETEDALLARIDEASRYVDVGQLAISTQCGFASSSEGNELDEDSQWRKLEVIGRAADRIWGR